MHKACFKLYPTKNVRDVLTIFFFVTNLMPASMGRCSTDPASGVANYFEKEKDVTYKRIPIFDNAGENILEHIPAVVQFIETGKYYGSVLVHCKKVFL